MSALHTCVPVRLRDALDAPDDFRQAVGVETVEYLNEKVDEHADQPITASPGDEAVCLGALDAQKFGHFSLRFSAGEMQPGGARGKRCLLVHKRCWLMQRQRLSHGLKIFS